MHLANGGESDTISNILLLMPIQENHRVFVGDLHLTTCVGIKSLGRFFGALPSMIYFYIQHKVQRVPGGWLLRCDSVPIDRLHVIQHIHATHFSSGG
jgi:hypothetical protein